jgi:DNA polymerase-3 subunit chi
VTEVRFYHLQSTPLDRALPQLLERTLSRSWRAVVMARSKDRVEALNSLLWTYSREGFLAHGTAADGNADRQPVWLTESDENPNGASVLFLTDGAGSDHVGDYDLVCEMFDGNDDEALAAARVRWREYLTAGHHLTYGQQSDGGRWEKKAESNAEAAG